MLSYSFIYTIVVSKLFLVEQYEMKKKKQSNNYVDNKKLLESMKDYIDSVNSCSSQDEYPQISDYIGECISLIAKGLANRPNFINYPFKEDMISDGIENSLRYIRNFDPEKSSNPYGYFTQIIYYAFVRRIQREKRHLYTKYKMIEQKLTHDIADDEYLNVTKYGSDYADANMHDFIDKFEHSQKTLKKTAKSKKKSSFSEKENS